MKKNRLFFMVLPVLMLAFVATAQSLADLATPDDIMLRKPQPKMAGNLAAQQAAQRLVAEKAAAKAKAEAEELQRLRAEVAAQKKAREEAEAKAAMDRKAADAALGHAKAAEKAKVAAQKKIERLENPDPDERPQAAPKKTKIEVAVPQQDVVDEAAPKAKGDEAAKAGKKKLTGRPAVITAERTDYDRKEGIILFDRNVFVDDEQYQMHADQLFVFLDGTNELKRIVALGNVSITNEAKTAACAKAVYSREQQRIVMYGGEREGDVAWLRDAGGRKGDASEISGTRIIYWIDSGLATVEGVGVKIPAMKGGANPKDLFNPKGLGKDKKADKDKTDK